MEGQVFEWGVFAFGMAVGLFLGVICSVVARGEA